MQSPKLSSSKFQLLSTSKYENLSSRMQRLKQKRSHSLSRCASVDLMQSSDSSKNTRPNSQLYLNQRLASLVTKKPKDSHTQNMLDYSITKNAGRVAKNTGIRKYNQRILKEIGNVKTRAANSGWEVNKQIQPVVQSKQPSLQPASYLPTAHRYQLQSIKTGQYEYEQNNEQVQYAKQIRVSPSLQPDTFKRLVPGKIYTKECLEAYFAELK